MKKTILVSAVALAMSGTAYAAASDGLYGKIRLGLQSKDELSLVSGKLVFGFKGAEDLGNGLVASYGIEFEHDRAAEEGIGHAGLTNDASWVKLGGSFGEFIVGEYGDMAGYACGGTDILTYGSAEACDSVHNTSPANALQYRGSAGDVDFGVIMTQDGTGESHTLFGLKYSTGPFSVGTQFAKAADAAALGGNVPAGETGRAIGATYTINGITLGVTMSDNGADDDSTSNDIGVSVPLGNGTLVAVISSGDAIYDSTDLGYSAALGKSTYYGFEYNKSDTKKTDSGPENLENDDAAITAYIGMNF